MQFFVGGDRPVGGGTAGDTKANTLHMFNRSGVCLLYWHGHRPLHTLDAQQDQKLMFGLLFSLRSFTAEMDPSSVDEGYLGVRLCSRDKVAPSTAPAPTPTS